MYVTTAYGSDWRIFTSATSYYMHVRMFQFLPQLRVEKNKFYFILHIYIYVYIMYILGVHTSFL